MGLSAFRMFEADIVGLRKGGLSPLSSTVSSPSPRLTVHAYLLVTTSPAVPAVVNIFRLALIACSRADHQDCYTNLRTFYAVSENIIVCVYPTTHTTRNHAIALAAWSSRIRSTSLLSDTHIVPYTR